MCNCARSRVELKSKPNRVLGNPNLYFKFDTEKKQQMPKVTPEEITAIDAQMKLFRPTSSFLVLGPTHV